MSTVNIKSETRDGRVWYRPYRRVFLFFWSHYFPGKTKGVVSEGFASTDIHEVYNWLENRGY